MLSTLPGSLAEVLDHAAIANVLTGYSYGVDMRDWPLYRSIFVDRLEVVLPWMDIHETVDTDDWVARVAQTIAPFDGTQHRMTNVAIALDGDEAWLHTQMTARHMLVIDGTEHIQSIGGYYRHRVVRTGDGWRIACLGLFVTWEQGDRGLFELAAQRGPRPRRDVGEQGMTCQL